MAQGQEKPMAKVWVQVWTAQVPGSVEVEEALLREVEGLESVKAMVPMLVTVKDSDLVPPMVQETELPLSKYQETALAKGWGWVLGLEGHRHKLD